MHQGKKVPRWRGPELCVALRSLRSFLMQSNCQPGASKTPTATVYTVLIRRRTTHFGLGSTQQPCGTRGRRLGSELLSTADQNIAAARWHRDRDAAALHAEVFVAPQFAHS